MCNIIIEGIDRVGKGTLIKNLKEHHGALQVLHYQKPELLEYYKKRALVELSGGEDPPGEHAIKRLALQEYQRESFAMMFNLLRVCPKGMVLDRAHLGEVVYSHRYRGYDGSYVFELEKTHGVESLERDVLILMIASDLSYLLDDGESHDFTQREAEQADFINAFHRSSYQNKLLIDVTLKDSAGASLKSHAPPELIYEAVVESKRGNNQQITFVKDLDKHLIVRA